VINKTADFPRLISQLEHCFVYLLSPYALSYGQINRNTMEATGNKTKIIKRVYH